MAAMQAMHLVEAWSLIAQPQSNNCRKLPAAHFQNVAYQAERKELYKQRRNLEYIRVKASWHGASFLGLTKM